MNYSIISSSRNVLVIPCYAQDKEIKFFSTENSDLKTQIKKVLPLFAFKAEKKEQLSLLIGTQKVLLIGIVEKYTLEDLRVAYGLALKTLRKAKEFTQAFEFVSQDDQCVQAIVEALDLAEYSYDMYKKEKNPVLKLEFLTTQNKKQIIDTTLLVTKQVKFVRNIINENADVITPQKFEEFVLAFAKKYTLKTNILNEKEIAKQKLGLLSAVGQAAKHPARLIICEYNGNSKSKNTIALVGKGITFDSGGLNLKTGDGMLTMRGDMGGAAVVFGAFQSAVELKLPVNLILVLACAENAISHHAYKQGDTLVSYNGTTVEITNTDAEGRLVLADAISYLQKQYKPTQIIDLATLTGACTVAVGSCLIATMSNNQDLFTKLFMAGEKTYERLWQLPIYDEHRDLIKSDIGEIRNTGKVREAGTIVGGAFIEYFVEKGLPWAHLDIASVDFSDKEDAYIAKGATGKGVRLLVDYLKSL